MDPLHDHPHTEALFDVVRALAAGSHDQAEARLKTLLARVDVEAVPADLKYLVFGSALARRLSEASFEEANLYLTDFDLPQIRLFNLLGQHFHPVGLSTSLLNAMIVALTRGEDHPIVVDIGIGTGRQMEALIGALAAEPTPPRSLTVVGVEPSTWALDACGDNLRTAAGRAGIALHFHPFNDVIEAFGPAQWDALAGLARGAVLNASFALHHIRDGGGVDRRAAVLQRLAALEPRALLLAEPSSDHHRVDFTRRFHNCWTHFGQVFRLLDALPLEDRDRSALKVCFFGREITDVLGHDDEARSERHEDLHTWMVRLRAAGFRLADPARVAGGVPCAPTGEAHVVALAREGYVGIDHAGDTLVGLLCAVPGPHVAAPPAPVPAPSVRGAGLRPMDPEAYLAALIAVARADRVIHPAERAFIDRQAELLGVSTEHLWADTRGLEATLSAHGVVSERTRQAVVRDAVLLARLDGRYSDEERRQADALTTALGLDLAFLRGVEERFATYVPEALAGTPSWFTEYWLMGVK